MLDDLAMIHHRDTADALGTVEKQWQELQHDFSLPDDVHWEGVNQVVFAGMGGSGFAGLMAGSWPALKVPLTLVRNYDLPDFVSHDTLVVCASYSGDTEEEMAVLDKAEAIGAKIAVMASGGMLQDIASAKKHPFILLPKSNQPRYAVLAMFKGLLVVLERAGLIATENFMAEVTEAADFLKEQTALWRPDVPTKDNPAKQLAQELMGKSIVVYSGPKLAPAGYKWKISFNENAKHLAWFNQYPEWNHNEFMGWLKQPVEKPYVVIDLRSSLEHPRIQKRFELAARFLSGMRPDPHVVQAQGQSLLQQMVWTMAYGDFVSIYLALLNGIDPASVELMEKFKKALNE